MLIDKSSWSAGSFEKNMLLLRKKNYERVFDWGTEFLIEGLTAVGRLTTETMGLTEKEKFEKFEWDVLRAVAKEGSSYSIGAVLKCTRQSWASYTDRYGNSLLHIAAGEGNVSVCEELLRQQLVELRLCQDNNWGWNPLHCAAAAGKIETYNLIKERLESFGPGLGPECQWSRSKNHDGYLPEELMPTEREESKFRLRRDKNISAWGQAAVVINLHKVEYLMVN